MHTPQDPDAMLLWQSGRWLAIAAAALAAYLITGLLQAIITFVRTSRGLAGVPTAPDSSWLLGNALALARNSPWEKMNEGVLAEPAGIIKVRALNTYLVIVGSPQGIKQIFQTKQRDYGKDVRLSYQHFLNILGAGPTSGLVTAEGEHWRRQRTLMGQTLRTDILDTVIGIGKRAADRLSQKLEGHRASAKVIDMEEEFRLLTLQVIGEAMLSLPPDECDQVCKHLVLRHRAKQHHKQHQHGCKDHHACNVKQRFVRQSLQVLKGTLMSSISMMAELKPQH